MHCGRRCFFAIRPRWVYAALEEVVDNPLIDSVLAASAGVTLLQHSVEDRWDAVNWQMLHPRCHHGLHASLAAAAQASNLLSVVAIAQRANHLEQALNVTVNVGDFNRCPALHCAAHSGNVNIVRYLLSLGVPVDVGTALKYTALHIATSEGQLEVVRFLIELRADVNAKDNNGSTPLHKAADYGHLEVVRFLIKVHADVNAKNHYGCTPLHEASCSGLNLEVVRFLIDVDADVNAEDDVGRTPLYLDPSVSGPLCIWTPLYLGLQSATM